MAILNLEDRFWLIDTISRLASTKDLYIEAEEFLQKINLSKELSIDPDANWNFDGNKITWDYTWEKAKVEPLEVEIPKVIQYTLKKKYNVKTMNNADRVILSRIGILDVEKEF